MKTNSLYTLLISALIIQFALVGCETVDSKVDETPVAPQPEKKEGNRYGGTLDEGKPADSSGSRFGFSGDDAKKTGNDAIEKKKREVRDMTKRERDSADGVVEKAKKKKDAVVKKAKSTGPPKPSEYKYANKVSGDPLAVTLPGKNASLGEISVEKYDSSGQPTGQPLSKGTPVAIPDPNNPGQKIYFKVP